MLKYGVFQINLASKLIFLAFGRKNRSFFITLWLGPKWSTGVLDFFWSMGVDPPSAHV